MSLYDSSWIFFKFNLSLCPLEVVKRLPVHRYSVDIFSYSGPSGILCSYGIPFKLVLGGVRIVVLSISSHEQTQKTESAVFLYCSFSLFLKDQFFQII